MTGKRFKTRVYEKEKNVVIYDEGDKVFDGSFREFEDAYYLKMKLKPVIDKLNELAKENEQLKEQFVSIFSKLGKKNLQCEFCEYGDFYTEYDNHGKDITHGFRCKKGHGDYYLCSEVCYDWKIKVD